MKHAARASGVLLPIFSLPSEYGIGTFGKAAYDFTDSLKRAKQKYWQILPLCPTSYGDSPYQSFSTFAGNPYFIDLELLTQEGLLSKEECDAVDFGDNRCCIDYGKLYENRYPLLKKAFVRWRHRSEKGFKAFSKQNAWWLQDYCLFMAVKSHFDQASWLEWDEDIKFRQRDAMARYTRELATEIEFHEFLQYTFTKQWSALKSYVNRKGIRIFGDLPIYVAMDSADVWANPSLFQLDGNRMPKKVAGVPPDAFSEEGQLWGNPLFEWKNHQADGYQWWIRRIQYAAALYDTVRIDHFRGFDAFWAIPYGEKNAVKGKWCKGYGRDLFRQVQKQLGEVDIIAEDLGVQTDSLRALLRETDYPGMKVLQFGFSNREDSEHLPHNYSREAVVYTGTHDNTTLVQWYRELKKTDRAFVDQYCRVTSENLEYDIIAALMQSVARLVIIPLQDYLGLDGKARINTPSTLGGNWMWRLQRDQFDKNTEALIAQLTTRYFR